MYTYQEGSEVTDQVAHAVWCRKRDLQGWLEGAERKRNEGLRMVESNEIEIFRLKNNIEECEDFLKTRA